MSLNDIDGMAYNFFLGDYDEPSLKAVINDS